MKNIFRKYKLAVDFNVDEKDRVLEALDNLGYEDDGYVKIDADVRRGWVVVWPKNPFKRVDIHELQDYFDENVFKGISVCWYC